MAVSVPYVTPIYDDRATTARMSDLIRQRGQSQATAIRQQGAADAALWGNVIETAGRTMSDLVKYQAGAPERKLREAQTARLTREERKAFESDEIDRQTAGMPTEDAATIAEGYGHPQKAQEIRERAMTVETKHLQLEELKGRRIADEFAKAGDVVRLAMSPEMPAEKRQSLWTEGRTRLGKALDLMPEDLASIPEVVPTDPKVLASYLEMTMTARERLETSAQAAKALSESRRTERDLSDYVAKHVASAKTPEDFAAARLLAERQGAANLFDATYGTTFTPAVAAKANDFLMAGKADKSLQAKDVLVNGKPSMATFNPSDGTWLDQQGQRITGEVPPIPPREPSASGAAGTVGGKPVSQPQRAEALAAKDSAMKTLEKVFLESNLETNPEFVRGQTAPTPASVALLDYGKLKVENSYREKLGLPPIASLSESGYGASSGAPLSALAKPAAPPVATSAPPPVTSTPPASSVQPGVGPTNEAALKANVEALMTEIQGLERQGKANSPLYAQRLAELRRLLGG